MTDHEHEPASEDNSVWIRTEEKPDGTGYFATISITNDIAFPLDRETARDYTEKLIDLVNRAEYDSCIFKQVKHISRGVEDQDGVLRDIADMLSIVRGKREDISFDRYPVSYSFGINAEGEAFVLINIDGENVGQWSVEDTRAHATSIMDALVVAPLDDAYLDALTSVYGVDQGIARNVISDLLEYR